MFQAAVGPLQTNISLPEETPGLELNWAALLIVMVIIPTIGGNILVILAVWLEKKLQNATNFFLMSLAVADLLVGLLVMPIALITILYGIAIPIPIKGLRNYPHPNNITFTSNHTCVLKTDTFQEFIIFGSLVAFFIPLTIMMIIYFLTVRVLRKKVYLLRSKVTQRFSYPIISTVFQREQAANPPQPEQPDSTGNSLARIQEKTDTDGMSSPTGDEKSFRRLSTMGKKSMQTLTNEQRASKVLGIVFLLFVVMWCPFFITNITSALCGPCDANIIGRLMEIFSWVGYVSSGINPLVYTLFNKTFRQAFTRYITCNYRNFASKEQGRSFRASTVDRMLTHISPRSSVAENAKLFTKQEIKNETTDYRSPLGCLQPSAQTSTGVVLDKILLTHTENCKQEERVSCV
uniref:Isoform 2 of 5-hydroxytryptamine receptor 2B n=1 Tax=Dichotomyctere fluviatilis TaxID=2593188 RepID=Q8UUG8-2